MRGKLIKCSNIIISGRITPADAGKTYFNLGLSLLNQDHPRGCGENTAECGKLAEEAGSPPRMRGKLKSDNLVGILTGITPADAGKTCRQLR